MMRTRVKVDKRQAILDAAGRLLAVRRFADVALEDVAAEANVAKGTLYLYFDSKDEIYLAYVGQMVEPLFRSLRNDIPIAAATSALSALERVLTDVLEFARQNPAIHDIMQGTTRASQQAKHEKTKSILRQIVIDVLKSGIRSGEMRKLSPELSADLILAGLPRIMERAGAKPKELQVAVRHAIQFLAHGLLADAPGKTPVETT